MNDETNAVSSFDPDMRVLGDNELDAVSGGEVSHHDFVIVKLLDKATPILFLA